MNSFLPQQQAAQTGNVAFINSGPPIFRSEDCQTFPAGTTIHVMGEPAGCAFEVIAGEAMQTISTAPGRQVITMMVDRGGVIGHAIDGRYVCTAVALTSVTVRPIDLKSQRYIDGLAEQFEAGLRHQALLSGAKVIGRIAGFLCNRAKAQRIEPRRNGASNSTVEIRIPIALRDLAGYLGMKAETLSRGLTELRKSRVIETPNYTSIRIVNMAALQALCE